MLVGQPKRTQGAAEQRPRRYRGRDLRIDATPEQLATGVPRACLDSRRPETVAPPRAWSGHGCRTSDAAPLGDGASPPLVPPRTGGRGSLSMPGKQHAAGRYEVLVPTGTHRGGTGPLQCSPHIGSGIPTPSARTLGSQKS